MSLQKEPANGFPDSIQGRLVVNSARLQGCRAVSLLLSGCLQVKPVINYLVNSPRNESFVCMYTCIMSSHILISPCTPVDGPVDSPRIDLASHTPVRSH